MADYLSTQAAKIVDSVSTINTIKQNYLNPLQPVGAGTGRGGLFFDFTINASAAADEKVYLTVLKAGWIVNPLNSYVFTSADAGTALVADIGYEKIPTGSTLTADPDAFADGIDIGAVGQVGFASGTAPVALTGDPVKLNEDVWLVWTYKTATSPNAVKVTGFLDYLL